MLPSYLLIRSRILVLTKQIWYFSEYNLEIIEFEVLDSNDNLCKCFTNKKLEDIMICIVKYYYRFLTISQVYAKGS